MIPQAEERLAEATELHASIGSILDKCSGYASLTIDAVDRGARIRTRAREIHDELRQSILSITRQSLEKAEQAEKRLDEAKAQVPALSAQIERLSRAINDLQVSISARAEELKTTSSPAEQDDITKNSIRDLEELRKKEADLKSTLVDLEVSTIPALKAKWEDALREQEQLREGRWKASRYEIHKLLTQLTDQREQANGLAKSLEVSEALQKSIRTDFRTKVEDFGKAEELHRREARMMLVAMLVIGALSAALIYYLFVSATVPSASPTTASPASGWSTIDTVRSVEQVIVFASGRLATLLLALWALKYIGNLHRAHAEQSVIYRDRLAALGVIQAMLDASGSVEEKRQVLKLLADGYLNFEQSAFRMRQSRVEKTGENIDATVDRQIKHVRDAVEAVKPLFDAVSKVGDKVK